MRTDLGVRGSWRWAAPALCFLAGAAVGAAGYFAAIPTEIRIWMRAGVGAISLAVVFAAGRGTPARQTALAFLAISAGMLIAGLLFADFAGTLGIRGDDPRGYAVDKIGESLPIVLLIFLAAILGEGGPSSLFSIVNGFMEELWFRGLFLSRFERLLGPRSAFWLTAALFGLLHLLGSFSGTLGTLLLSGFTVLLGLAFGLIVRRTGSLWGAVLGHFFADFFLLLGYFATAG